EASRKEWTPVPLPKPLYLERREVHTPSVDSRVITAALDAAIAEGERNLRAALAEPEVIPFVPRPAEPAPSRFASMGIIDETNLDSADLDAMLRRRRVAGDKW